MQFTVPSTVKTLQMKNCMTIVTESTQALTYHGSTDCMMNSMTSDKTSYTENESKLVGTFGLCLFVQSVMHRYEWKQWETLKIPTTYLKVWM